MLRNVKKIKANIPAPKGGWVGGGIAQWIAYLLPDPAAAGSIPSVPFFIGTIVDVAEVNQRCC